MTRWEYSIHECRPSLDDFDFMGENRWELVGFIDTPFRKRYIFKRPLPPSEK